MKKPKTPTPRVARAKFTDDELFKMRWPNASTAEEWLRTRRVDLMGRGLYIALQDDWRYGVSRWTAPSWAVKQHPGWREVDTQGTRPRARLKPVLAQAAPRARLRLDRDDWAPQARRRAVLRIAH